MIAEMTADADTEPNKRKPGRLDYIEGMRGVAALYVAVGHIFTMIDPYHKLQREGASPVWLAWLSKPMWYGHLAVAAFIVISGFCLQLSLYNKGDGRLHDLKRFAKRRCWRILPPYYACLLISIVVALTVTTRQFDLISHASDKLAVNPEVLPWSQYLPVTPANTIAHFFMAQNLTPDWMYKINGVLWSISIEFQLYFLFPVLVWALFRKGPWAVLAPTITIAAIIMIAVPAATKMYVWFMPLFALGMVGAQLAFDPTRYREIRDRIVTPKVLVSLSLISFLLTCVACSFTKSLWLSDCLLSISVVGVLVLGSQGPHRLVQVFSFRRVVWLGAFSYSLYLMHHPILQLLQAFRPSMVDSLSKQFAFLFLIGMPIILTLCYGFYWVFERPFVSGKSRPKPNEEAVPGF